MTTQEVVTVAELARRIQTYSQTRFTERLNLNIPGPKSQHWSLYFYRGALFWGYSQEHLIRRCYRHISQHCPQLPINLVRPQYWDYNYLAGLMRQGRIQPEQMAAIIESTIAEILFDIYQYGEQLPYRSGFQLTSQSIPQKTIDLLIDSGLVLSRADEAWQRAKQDWNAWQQAGLSNYSPNQAPAILKSEELQGQTSVLAYYNLTSLADGKQTLRELAIKLRQNLLLLTQSLMPSIRQGLIGLIDIEDFSHSSAPVTGFTSQPTLVQTSASLVPSQAVTPLVAYIDDSPNDSLTMSRILTQANYRFVNVQDPVIALPTLLEHKPDLIFLDLVMPIANGYEICAQIRRVSAFKDTPVIILTSNDGIVDRVRAKMVGSSGFLAKPINQEKVLAIVQRYLPASRTTQSQRQQTPRSWSLDQQV